MKRALPYISSFAVGAAVTAVFAHQFFWWQESRLSLTVLSTNLTDSYMLERDMGKAMLDRNRKTLCSQIIGARKALSAVWTIDQESLRQIIEQAEKRADEIEMDCDYAS